MAESSSGPGGARERSLLHFAEGFNCAESVLRGVSEALGCASDAAPRIATGFGGGIAGHGETCGAVVGGVMAIGLLLGRESPTDEAAKARTTEAVTELVRAFREQHGTLCCRELTGCDLLTEEGQAKAQRLDLHNYHCPKFVALAATLSASAVSRYGASSTNGSGSPTPSMNGSGSPTPSMNGSGSPTPSMNGSGSPAHRG